MKYQNLVRVSIYLAAPLVMLAPIVSSAADFTVNQNSAGGQACPMLAMQCPAGTYDTIISGCNHACVYPSTSAPGVTGQANGALTGGAGTTVTAGTGINSILSPFNTAVPGISGGITTGTAAGSGTVQNAFTSGGILTGGTTVSNQTDGGKECPLLARTLKLGTQGNDVASLQAYLASQGYLSANATGYYGTLTQQAVQAWQSAQGIVSGGSPTTTGFGAVGPLSRQWLSRCTPPPGKTTALSASPTNGTAPLAVTFTILPSGLQTSDFDQSLQSTSTTLSLVFGDGASTTIASCVGGALCPSATTSVAHTYNVNGVYDAQLIAGFPGTTPRCDGITIACTMQIARPIRILGQARIRVGTTTASSTVVMTATPASGNAPLTITAAASGLTANSQYIFQYGDGGNSGPLTADNNGTITASHTYATAGKYTATVQSYISCAWGTPYRCMIAVLDLAKALVTVTDTTSSSGGGQLCPLYMPHCALGTSLTWTYNSNTGCSVPSCVASTSANGALLH